MSLYHAYDNLQCGVCGRYEDNVNPCAGDCGFNFHGPEEGCATQCIACRRVLCRMCAKPFGDPGDEENYCESCYAHAVKDKEDAMKWAAVVEAA